MVNVYGAPPRAFALVTAQVTGRTSESVTIDQSLFSFGAIRARAIEENHEPGDLSSLTRLNLQMIRRLRAELPPDDQDQVELRTYDQIVRFNIIIVDELHCVAQPYLPSVRGVDSPTLVMRRRGDGAGMFSTFQSVFSNLWERGRDCA